MITFIEDTNKGYSHRTYENARLADATLAFAADFTTSGEIMTQKAAEKYNKVYCQIPLQLSGFEISRLAYTIAQKLNENNCHTLNIAGNGLSRLVKHNITQKECDTKIEFFIAQLRLCGVVIKEIRSGGQTGADESGLKAAEMCGINSICLCPKGWRFRTETEDISNEKLFKERFENKKRL